ncbi:MAG: hypothetical protein WA734_04735 [Candidatus Acidiferrales bacterium]
MPCTFDVQQFGARRYELQRCREFFICAEGVTGAMDEQSRGMEGWEVSRT